jgi:hypothetical protein
MAALAAFPDEIALEDGVGDERAGTKLARTNETPGFGEHEDLWGDHAAVALPLG